MREGTERDTLRILCVDDEQQTLAMYMQALGADTDELPHLRGVSSLGEDLFGKEKTKQLPPQSYAVTLCGQAEEAVQAVRTALTDEMPFSVAFIDVRMPPGQTGLWAAEQIRAIDPHVQIVIVTAYSDVTPGIIAASIPPVHKLLFIHKPFHIEEITQFANSLSAKWRTEKFSYSLYREMERQVTERTSELKASQKQYADLVENAHDIIQSVGLDGRFLFVNKAWHNVLGYSKSDLETLTVFDIIDKDQMDHCQRTFDEIIKGTQVVEFETVFITKNGGKIHVEGNALPMIEEGRTVATHGFFRDITNRINTEAELTKTLSVLRESFRNLINLVTATVEVRDPYTAGHQVRVADLARSIATKMGLSPEMIEGIRLAGIVHDLGKISTPSEILTKPRLLTDIEFSLIKEHSKIGYELLKPIDFPWPVADIVHQHHERIDGSGYPQGLTGDQILIESKILCVADVVEAMASHRPYRPALGIDAAIQEIQKKTGIWYDKQIVDACVELFHTDGYQFRFH